jgi:hypothetical protein
MKIIIQDFYEDLLKSRKVDFKRDCRLGETKIDFIANIGGKWNAVEIRSSYSNVYTTIGELTSLSKEFSHIILVATKDFLEKFRIATERTGVLANIGTVIFDNGEFIESKQPVSKEYFSNKEDASEIQKNSITRKRFTQQEEKFFRRHEGGPFRINDIVKELDKSFPTAYRFVLDLRALGLAEEVSKGAHPKMFITTDRLNKIMHA